MKHISIQTKKSKQIIDITNQIQDQLEIENGICTITVLHTTCAITCADLDPGTDLDYLDAFDEIVPKLKYRHPHNPAHVKDHIMSAIIGTSISLPVEKTKLILGTWQRVIFVELDGPRTREIVITQIKEAKN